MEEAIIGGSKASPPKGILYLAIVEILVLVALLIPDSKTFNWIGFLLGAVVVPATISFYRSVDKSRQRNRKYSCPAWAQQLPVPVLIFGVALTGVHAFFLALVEKLA